MADDRLAPAVRAIVLDFNGTLAQDDHLVAPLYVDVFASIGAPLTADEYHRELAALPDRDVFTRALDRAGLPFDAAQRDSLVQARLDGYLEAVADQPPITPPAIEFVRAAARRVPLAITSGAFREEIVRVLEAAGVADQFIAVITIEDVSRGKPDPEGFRRALESINVATGRELQPHETIAVEDATQGAQAARAAGMRVAAIRGPGYDPASGHADLIIDRLDLAALELMLGPGVRS